MPDTPVIINNEKTHRFEMEIRRELAYLPYQIKGDVLVLFYIFVPPPARGRGHSGRLIRYALDFAREHDLAIEVHCSFIARYLELNPLLSYRVASHEK